MMKFVLFVLVSLGLCGFLDTGNLQQKTVAQEALLAPESSSDEDTLRSYRLVLQAFNFTTKNYPELKTVNIFPEDSGATGIYGVFLPFYIIFNVGEMGTEDHILDTKIRLGLHGVTKIEITGDDAIAYTVFHEMGHAFEYLNNPEGYSLTVDSAMNYLFSDMETYADEFATELFKKYKGL